MEKTFESLNLSVLVDLNKGRALRKVVLHKSLMSDVVINMSSEVEPSLNRELVRAGYVGTILDETIALWISDKLEPGTLLGFDTNELVIFSAKKVGLEK